MGLLPPRKLSAQGAHFIGQFEGLRYEPYNDAAGNATIGYGHLLHYGPVTAADRKQWIGFCQKEAIKLLQSDAEKAAAAVREIRPRITNQARFDALVSLAFNCGAGIVGPGHTIGAEVRKKDRGNTADAFLLYDKAGSISLAGLTRRREAERRLWRTGKYA